MNENDSILFVKFKELNSTDLQLSMQNVTPMQLLAVAGYLEWKAKSILQAQELQMMMETEEQNKPKIALPDSYPQRK
jgi:hypothetical protein